MHLVGAGVIDLGLIGILPSKSNAREPAIPRDEKVLFFKESETAEPGYYKVDI